MTKEKQLLLKDLCARLPYEIYLHVPSGTDTLLGIGENLKYLTSYIDEGFKPYLRPMYSMTNEERAERVSLLWELEGHINEDVTYKYQDWLNAHHLDYRDLIPMGLAIEAPKGMYNIK